MSQAARSRRRSRDAMLGQRGAARFANAYSALSCGLFVPAETKAKFRSIRPRIGLESPVCGCLFVRDEHHATLGREVGRYFAPGEQAGAKG